MSARKDKEMEKTPQSKQRGKETGSKETHNYHTPLLPAKEPMPLNVQRPERTECQISEALEYPRTPVPWSKLRASRMQQDPGAGDGEGSSFSTSTNVREETETSSAVGVAAGGDGDHQAQQMESVAQVKKKVKFLCPDQQSNRLEATDVLENFLGQFLTYLHECPDRPYFRNIEELALGGSYEYEKFLHPGEFEVMLRISVPDCIHYTEVEGYSGLFYTLTLLRKSRSFPAAFLLEDGRTISSRNIMEEFWKQVDHFANVSYSVPFPGWQVRLEKKTPNCPAVTLVMLDNQGAKYLLLSLIPTLEVSGPWPYLRKAKEILEEKEPLLPLMRVFYFIAKQSPGKHNKETWRISFSHVEKEILNRHASPQACRRYHGKECCRKDCLKMLEDLVTALKTEYPQMLAHLSTYHAQTSFLHTLWEWKDNANWKPCEAAPCFERVLENFLYEVATAQLSHFFLPRCNLFGAKFFPPTKLKFLWSHLKEKEKEGRMKTAAVSRKRGYSSPPVSPDMAWPLMTTLGLIGLVSVGLPYMTP
ncbi:cyclic GMP-AMP synthase-like [Sceloporus undulatus]|uniref:cyclic GMP-AMP synthase-like n=1 Tax=Sceloporus undulatus TaxID=8520 RepID=UPI001C4B74C9|nr:cyclic GMP-AMP synthase-like [Sceloporus undulatus]